LTFATEAGPWGQWFGTVETFQRREQLWFQAIKDRDESFRIRFNDNGHGSISGSLAWEMPVDQKCLMRIFQQYRTQEAVEQQLVRPVTQKAIYMTGPLMSSTESAAERRNELLQLIEDQIENGIYLTRTTQLEEEDPITKEKRRRNVAEIVKDKDGNVVRAAESPIKDFCIKTFNLTINEVRYDKEVEQQIQQQQQAIMAVRIAMANAQRAEQDARTVAEQGKADAARAKWEQEKENATIVAKAEGEKKQATLRAEAAKFYKEEQLLKAEADAGYRAKIMAADNALEKRLEAYVETQKIWAAAVANYKGNWVPAISSSGGGSGAGSGMQTLVDMLSLKTARELGIDAGLQPKK
jgi:regulator of protease activity HflC (stomatin/prohibitin superfamily)